MPWVGCFIKACDTLPLVGYHLDCLYSPDPDTRREAAEELTRDGTIARMEDELHQETKEVSSHGTDPARAA